MSKIMKTLKLFLIVSLFFIAGIIKAQDVIVKKDNSTILSKVLRISNSEIEYKKWSNLDGPTYVISVSEILSINYENGDIDRFEDSSNNQILTQQNKVSQKDHMERDGSGLKLNGRMLSDSEVKDLIGEDYYNTYESAKGQINGGGFFTATFIISLVGTVGLAAYSITNKDPSLLQSVYITGAVADISLLLMCILNGAGKGRMNWVADEYNRKAHGNSYSYNLSPSIMTSKTPQLQNSYGLGLTFSMNF